VRKALFSHAPELQSSHVPKDIKLDKHNREKYQRTHEGANVFAEDEEQETDSDEEKKRPGPHEWRSATKNVHNREALRKELVKNDPTFFEPERVDPADENSPVKHRLNTKPMVSLTKSLALAREIRTKGTSGGVAVPMVSHDEVAAKRPASSADYSAIPSAAPLVAPLIPDDDAPKVAATAPTKSFALSPKRMVRTDIGYVDTTSAYAKYNLADLDRNITISDMNRRDYENDDGYDDEQVLKSKK